MEVYPSEELYYNNELIIKKPRGELAYTDVNTGLILYYSRISLPKHIKRILICKHQFISSLQETLKIEVADIGTKAYFRGDVYVIPSDYFINLTLSRLSYLYSLVTNKDFQFYKENATDKMIANMYSYTTIKKVAYKGKVYLVSNHDVVCCQHTQIEEGSELYNTILAKLALVEPM